MKNYFNQQCALTIASLFLFLLQCNCKNNQEKKINPSEAKTINFKKPGSNYTDSFHVYNKSVVVYNPDSLQLKDIKAAMDSNVFDGTMHEYFYQIRNARNIIKTKWTGLSLYEIKNYRFLVFHKNDGSIETIDLNLKNDICGMYLFKNEKSPQLADMTNIETALNYYFNK